MHKLISQKRLKEKKWGRERKEAQTKQSLAPKNSPEKSFEKQKTQPFLPKSP